MPQTPSTAKRLSERAKPWIVDALKRHGEGEEINWELSVSAFPDPSKSDDEGIAFIPALVLYIEIPAPEASKTIYAAPIFAPFGLDKDRVDYVVKTTLESLRKSRSAQLDSE